jgi:hypothetical protein
LLVCNWPHSVGQNHFFVKMLFNRDSAIQKCFQKTDMGRFRISKRQIWENSAAPPDNYQCSIKLQDFFPKHRYGKIVATVRTTWIPVWKCSSIRQVSQFKTRRPEASQHGSDARASDMEIACIRSAVRTTILLVRTREASIGSYLQRTYDCPDDRATPSGRGSQIGKIFSEIFRISVVQLSIQTVPSFIKLDAHLNC